MISIKDITNKASEMLFGKPLVVNVHRAVLVEAMVDSALSDWTWCSSDYSSFDFMHPDKTRIEVKQSAIRQSWSTQASAKPSWDIKPRTGQWVDGNTWVEGAGRNADIYIFALHPRDDDQADHRDVSQWQFFVVAAADLPDLKRLSLARVQVITKDVGFEQLAETVNTVHRAVVAAAPSKTAVEGLR